MDHPLFVILLRWLHMVPAAVVIGGLVFLRFVLPAGLAGLDGPAAGQVVTRIRRVWRMILHTCILLLLVSGTLNSIRLFPGYSAQPGVLHGLWGAHVLLGLVTIAIGIWLAHGPFPPVSHRRAAAVNILLLLALVAAAGAVKHLRETATHLPPAAATGP
jgi:uncharacterized membrane protein